MLRTLIRILIIRLNFPRSVWWKTGWSLVYDIIQWNNINCILLITNESGWIKIILVTVTNHELVRFIFCYFLWKWWNKKESGTGGETLFWHSESEQITNGLSPIWSVFILGLNVVIWHWVQEVWRFFAVPREVFVWLHLFSCSFPWLLLHYDRSLDFLFLCE